MPRSGLSPEVVVREAALLVDEHGPDALTLAAVAKRFGVALPSLYKHVGGVEDLHGRLALRASLELGPALRRATTGKAGTDAIRAAGAAYRSYATAHPGCYRYLLRPRPDDEVHAAASAEILATLADVLAGYHIREPRALVDAVRFLRSVLHGFVSLELDGGFAMPQSVDGSFAAAVDGLDHALRAWPR